MAEALARAGAAVALSYARSTAEAEEAVQGIRAAGGEARLVPADLADPAAIDAMFAELNQSWGGADIVVHNAAATRDGYVMLMPLDAWDEVLQVNLRAVFLSSRHALRPMIRKKWGRIINVISPAALAGKAGAANYAAAKGGLLSFTRSLAREVGRYGITVNAVSPGVIETRLAESIPAGERQALRQQIALGRFGEAREVAPAVCFLASPAASYVSGAILAVDGGLGLG